MIIRGSISGSQQAGHSFKQSFYKVNSASAGCHHDFAVLLNSWRGDTGHM